MEKEMNNIGSILANLKKRNNMQKSPNEHWKITDEYVTDMHGNIHTSVNRVRHVADILRNQYINEVCDRGREYYPLDNILLKTMIDFLTNKSSKTSMLLIGTPGTGKTTCSKAMANTIKFLYNDYDINKNCNGVNVKPQVITIKASELGELIKNDPEKYKRVKGCTCLFIDDLGFNGECEVINNYGVKQKPIIEIIEYRYDYQLMTVCTSNMTTKDIQEQYGYRVYSRLQEQFVIVPVVGKDYRSNKH